MVGERERVPERKQARGATQARWAEQVGESGRRAGSRGGAMVAWSEGRCAATGEAARPRWRGEM